jgi:hypothetical protein
MIGDGFAQQLVEGVGVVEQDRVHAAAGQVAGDGDAAVLQLFGKDARHHGAHLQRHGQAQHRRQRQHHAQDLRAHIDAAGERARPFRPSDSVVVTGKGATLAGAAQCGGMRAHSPIPVACTIARTPSYAASSTSTKRSMPSSCSTTRPSLSSCMVRSKFAQLQLLARGQVAGTTTGGMPKASDVWMIRMRDARSGSRCRRSRAPGCPRRRRRPHRPPRLRWRGRGCRCRRCAGRTFRRLTICWSRYTG